MGGHTIKTLRAGTYDINVKKLMARKTYLLITGDLGGNLLSADEVIAVVVSVTGVSILEMSGKF